MESPLAAGAPARFRRTSRLAAILVSPEESDTLTWRAQEELRLNGWVESAATAHLRQEEEDIVSGHMVRPRDRATPNPTMLARQQSPMLVGAALRPCIASGATSPTSSHPASVASAPAPVSDLAGMVPPERVGSMPLIARSTSAPELELELAPPLSSAASSSTGGSPFASRDSSPEFEPRFPLNLPAGPLSGFAPPAAPSSLGAEDSTLAELKLPSAPSTPGSSVNGGAALSSERRAATSAPSTPGSSVHGGSALNAERRAAALSSAPVAVLEPTASSTPATRAAPIAAPSTAPNMSTAPVASTAPNSARKRSKRPKFLSLSALGTRAQNYLAPSPAPPPKTYEAQQIESAMKRIGALANRNLSFFDRLERVRRGQSTTPRQTRRQARNDAAPASYDATTAAEAADPVEAEARPGEVKPKRTQFALPEDETGGGGGGKVALPTDRELARTGTLRAKQRHEETEAQMGLFEKESSRYESFQFEEEESKLHLGADR